MMMYSLKFKSAEISQEKRIQEMYQEQEIEQKKIIENINKINQIIDQCNASEQNVLYLSLDEYINKLIKGNFMIENMTNSYEAIVILNSVTFFIQKLNNIMSNESLILETETIKMNQKFLQNISDVLLKIQNNIEKFKLNQYGLQDNLYEIRLKKSLELYLNTDFNNEESLKEFQSKYEEILALMMNIKGDIDSFIQKQRMREIETLNMGILFKRDWFNTVKMSPNQKIDKFLVNIPINEKIFNLIKPIQNVLLESDNYNCLILNVETIMAADKKNKNNLSTQEAKNAAIFYSSIMLSQFDIFAKYMFAKILEQLRKKIDLFIETKIPKLLTQATELAEQYSKYAKKLKEMEENMNIDQNIKEEIKKQQQEIIGNVFYETNM